MRPYAPREIGAALFLWVVWGWVGFMFGKDYGEKGAPPAPARIATPTPQPSPTSARERLTVIDDEEDARFYPRLVYIAGEGILCVEMRDTMPVAVYVTSRLVSFDSPYCRALEKKR